MAKPVDWIGPFVEGEVALVIAWCYRNRDAQNDSDIIGSRFDDDHSNFRSTVKSSTLPWEPLAQISQVVSCKDPIVIIITDGYTQIKAKLSDSAVRTLESEMEEKIALGMKGDVFAIKETMVASTPYGPADEHIQLEIQEIEYKHHLRKSLGQSTSIQERREAGRLLTEIAEIRLQQYAKPEDHAEPESTRANANATAITGASRPSGQNLTNESHSPQSQRSQLPSSPAAFTQQSSGTQRAVATQIPTWRKRKAPPTLEEDGFEMKQGNNLARPYGPGRTQPTTRPSPDKRRHFDTDRTGETLRRLLRKETSDMQQQRQTSVGPPIDLTSQSSDESPRSSPPAAATVPDISGGVEQMSIVRAEQTLEPTSGQSVQGDKSQLLPAPPKYGSRRIPLDQRKLLEKQDSWVPSLPGKQLPHPNVPVQLLGQWHDQPSPVENDDASVDYDAAEGAMDTSEASSESSEDEELDWEATPSQKRPQLPPDSSTATGENATPLGIRAQRLPDSSQSSSHTRQQLPPDSTTATGENATPLGIRAQRLPDSSQSSSHTRQQLPPDSTTATGENATPLGTRARRPTDSSQSSSRARQQLPPDSSSDSVDRSPPMLKQSQRSLGSSPSSAVNRSQMSVDASSAESGTPRQPMRSKPLDPKRQLIPHPSMMVTGPRTSPLTSAQHSINRPNQTSRPTSAGSIVKGIQLAGGDGMDIEMSVPRALEEKDPIEITRQKRRDSLKPRQREKWLKDNYEINPLAKTLGLSMLLSSYRGVYHTDIDCSLSEWTEAMAAAFPELYPDGAKTAQGGLMLKGNKPVYVDDTTYVRDWVPDDKMVIDTDSAAPAGATGDFRTLSTGSRVKPSTTSSTGSVDFWGYANPVATDKDMPMLPPPSWVRNCYEYRDYPREGESAQQTRDRVNKMEFLRNIEREVGKTRADEAARLAAEARREREARGVFGDFVEATNNVRPGGAFAAPAAPSGGQQGGRTSGGGRGGAENVRGGGRGMTRGRGGTNRGRGRHDRLDVLQWDL